MLTETTRVGHSHLTGVGGTLIAWHATQDIQAVNQSGHERLYIDGQPIVLKHYHYRPAQIVSIYCTLNADRQRRMVKLLKSYR